MLVRFNTIAAGRFTARPGDVLNLGAEDARPLIAGGYAVEVTAGDAKPSPAPPAAAEGEEPSESAADPFAALDLSDSVKQRMTAAGWATLNDVRLAAASEGGLVSADGIGKVTAEQIVEELNKLGQ